MTLPNFLIVGAPKAGTTSLYYYLSQHPEIVFSVLKEPKYFSSLNQTFPHNGPGDRNIDKYAVRTFDEYRRLFVAFDRYKRVGEASPDYLYWYESSPFEIKDTLGDIPIVIVLRDPTLRAFSSYSNLIRESRETSSFRKALDAEEERLRDNWDFMWAYKRTGLYYSPVKAYQDTFTRVKILLLEDLAGDAHAVLRELYEFLNVDKDFIANCEIHHNPSGKPTNFLAKFILNRNNLFAVHIREFLKAHVPRKTLEKTAGKYLKKLELSIDDQMYLREYFKDDIGKLERLIAMDLSGWK